MPGTESDAQERDQGQQLMAAELGTEGTQEIPCLGTLGSSARLWVMLISQHPWSTRVLQLEMLLEPCPSPEPALCLNFPVCKVSKITHICCKRAGAWKCPVHLKSLSQQIVIPKNSLQQPPYQPNWC